ncbi:CLUMA_CG008340, isoform A [Clunio marinus]|uniref:CLUMA_CG008340, isoform A n=1 Tax=Clunio marinus TaxID=568069 RepID=A0A1J1I3G1_9DIPT|nr:CLUMA_CG008340, isoform A [Clunio marinus]
MLKERMTIELCGNSAEGKATKKRKLKEKFRKLPHPYHITGIKTYFPTPNSNLYLPSFISPPDVYSNPFNATQTYQYQPIYYNSVNILSQSLTNANHNNCANNQTSVRISNNNNNSSNNFCGYCLPSATTVSAQNAQEIATVSQQQQQQELLLTGNSAQVEPALLLSHFTEINLSDSLKHQSLITHFNNNNISEISTTRSSSGDNFHKDIMVSSKRKLNSII